VSRIWKGGCIIRARLLEEIQRAYQQEPGLQNLLGDGKLRAAVVDAERGWRRTVRAAQERGIPVMAMAAGLSYFDSCRSERLPQNLTQAQRDFFGAHGYERLDRPGAGSVHTDWIGLTGKGDEE